ncbi:MAG: ASCH domain-containing protein [Methylomicrobium sp.]
MIALFSIKPEYVEKIFSGEKLYEYRKAIFKSNVKKIVIYCTKPVGMIVGEFEVEDILEDCPKSIWKKTKDHSGVTRSFYDEYFSGREKGYAINIGIKKVYKSAVNPFEVLDSFTPPQSFVYLDESTYEQFIGMACNGLDGFAENFKNTEDNHHKPLTC